jgi:hypothetical protein
MKRIVALVILTGAVSALALAPGCRKATTANPGIVHGEVTFQNRAMAGGLVVFVPNADRGCTGKMHTATVSADGTYQLADGAKAITPGWYRIALADPIEWYGSDWAQAFPAALRRPDLSGLEREVKADQDHTFDFKIELAAR